MMICYHDVCDGSNHGIDADNGDDGNNDDDCQC